MCAYVYIIFLNTKMFRVLLAGYIYTLVWFLKQIYLIHLNNINKLIFIMQAVTLYCEVGT